MPLHGYIDHYLRILGGKLDGVADQVSDDMFQVEILHTFTHSPAPSRQRINIAAACTRNTFLLLQLPTLYSL